MYLPTSPPQKRQSEVSPHSDNLFPNVDNKVALIVGVGLAVAAILALLLGGLIKRYRLRHSSSSSESSPPETTQTPTRQPSFSQPHRPSNAGSDITEATLCCDEPVDLLKAKAKTKELDASHVPLPQPPAVLSNSHRPSSTLSVATTISQHTVKTERSSSWRSIAQRVDEKAGTTESNRMSTAPSFSSVPPSPRTPTSPFSPIRTLSPVSLKDSKPHIYGRN